jgi:hypothetical protein
MTTTTLACRQTCRTTRAVLSAVRPSRSIHATRRVPCLGRRAPRPVRRPPPTAMAPARHRRETTRRIRPGPGTPPPRGASRPAKPATSGLPVPAAGPLRPLRPDRWILVQAGWRPSLCWWSSGRSCSSPPASIAVGMVATSIPRVRSSAALLKVSMNRGNSRSTQSALPSCALDRSIATTSAFSTYFDVVMSLTFRRSLAASCCNETGTDPP